MPKPNNMNLSIPNPCGAKKEWLTPNAQGWSCSSCQKNVYDLTHKTDAEIEALHQANQGELCGSIPQNRLYNLPTNPFFRSWKSYMAVVVSTFSGLSLWGQSVKGELVLPPPPVSGKVRVDPQQDTLYTVNIRVMHTNRLMENAMVVLKAGTQFLAAGFTNSEGIFTCSVDRKKLQGRMLDIDAEHTNLSGHVRCKIVKSDSVQTVELDNVSFYEEHDVQVRGDVKTTYTQTMMLGGLSTIYVERVILPENQLLDSVVNEEPVVEVLEPEFTVSVFPNPSVAQFTVAFNAEFSGSLNVHSMTGVQVQQCKVRNQRTVLINHQFSAGTYILLFVNDTGETVFTQKLIVR